MVEMPKNQFAFLFMVIIAVGGMTAIGIEQIYQIKIDQVRDEVDIDYLKQSVRNIEKDISTIKDYITDNGLY